MDEFFSLMNDGPERWEADPEELSDILGDIGSALHGTFAAPEVTENLDCTPEQLLARIRELRSRYPGA